MGDIAPLNGITLLNKTLCEFHRTHTTMRLRTRLNLTFVTKTTFTRDWFKKSKSIAILLTNGNHCMYPLTVHIQAHFCGSAKSRSKFLSQMEQIGFVTERYNLGPGTQIFRGVDLGLD